MQVSYKNTDPIRRLSAVQSSALRTLMYFDLFQYPLTLPELVKFSKMRLDDLNTLESALQTLESQLMVFRFGEFWSLSNDYALIERRQNGNRTATEVWNKAMRRANFIQRFPFVRSVNISGSLSKNYFDALSDFDFFIITAPNRMWLCRTILTAYKKLFLFNSRKFFCINYFVDTDILEIPDKNVFTATEIITLKNMTGEKYFNAFMQVNQWVKKYYPNFSQEVTFFERGRESNFLKRILEKIFANRIGNMLDNFCLRFTLMVWKRKFNNLSIIEFETNMRSRKHVSKHHPQGFQFKVLQAYVKRMDVFEKQHGVILHNG